MLSKCVRLHNWEKHKASNLLLDRLKKQSLFVSPLNFKSILQKIKANVKSETFCMNTRDLKT